MSTYFFVSKPLVNENDVARKPYNKNRFFFELSLLNIKILEIFKDKLCFKFY